MVTVIFTEGTLRPHLASLGLVANAHQCFRTAGAELRAASACQDAPEAGAWTRQRGGSGGKGAWKASLVCGGQPSGLTFA